MLARMHACIYLYKHATDVGSLYRGSAMLFVTYLRVSTDRQGKSGLGLEAQRAAVLDHVAGKGEIAAEYVEIESGKRNERPQLARAMAEAKRIGAVLLIAKLD